MAKWRRANPDASGLMNTNFKPRITRKDTDFFNARDAKEAKGASVGERMGRGVLVGVVLSMQASANQPDSSTILLP